MTEPDADMESTRPISVAELLAKNGTLGAPAVTRRRRRRRGDTDSVSVAELTGEIPIIGDDHPDDPSSRQSSHQTSHSDEPRPEPERAPQRVSERVQERPPKAPPEKAPEKPAVQASAEPAGQAETKDKYWSEPEPRWPKSPVQSRRGQGPERSAYPRPLPQSSGRETPGSNGVKSDSGAEGMSPDPVDDYADVPVDVMDSEVRDAEPISEDSAYVRSFLQASEGTLFGGQTLADEMARQFSDRRKVAREADEVDEDGPADVGLVDHEIDHETEHETDGAPSRFDSLWHGGLIVLQSILAVGFGAGLFVAFDQLWQWNSIVALVLSVLVILGLVVGVRVVRKTEDIASTLIAVAVGALITLGPLALSLQAS